jgi:hypothetical protein
MYIKKKIFDSIAIDISKDRFKNKVLKNNMGTMLLISRKIISANAEKSSNSRTGYKIFVKS